VVSRLRTLCRILVRHRLLLSAGLCAAAGIILKSVVLIPVAEPLNVMTIEYFCRCFTECGEALEKGGILRVLWLRMNEGCILKWITLLTG
jgi:hypothetical protein